MFGARRASSRLLSAGARLYTTESRETKSRDKFYAQLGFDPRGDRSLARREYEDLPPWLAPLASDLLTIPASHAVEGIELNSDAAIVELCQMPDDFPNLKRILVTRGVSAQGTEMLRRALPQFAGLVDLHLNSVPIPEGWLKSLEDVRALHLWIEGWPVTGPMTLSAQHLEDVASLSNLQFLMIFGHQVSDNDVASLSQSPSLHRIILRGTVVTESGRQFLEERLPGATVQF